jgi:hypothetical protein
MGARAGTLHARSTHPAAAAARALSVARRLPAPPRADSGAAVRSSGRWRGGRGGAGRRDGALAAAAWSGTASPGPRSEEAASGSLTPPLTASLRAEDGHGDSDGPSDSDGHSGSSRGSRSLDESDFRSASADSAAAAAARRDAGGGGDEPDGGTAPSAPPSGAAAADQAGPVAGAGAGGAAGAAAAARAARAAAGEVDSSDSEGSDAAANRSGRLRTTGGGAARRLAKPGRGRGGGKGGVAGGLGRAVMGLLGGRKPKP